MIVELVGGPRDGEVVEVAEPPLPYLEVPLVSWRTPPVAVSDPVAAVVPFRVGYYQLVRWRNRPFVRPLEELVYHWQGE